jgi:hypothetical protein
MNPVDVHSKIFEVNVADFKEIRPSRHVLFCVRGTAVLATFDEAVLSSTKSGGPVRFEIACIRFEFPRAVTVKHIYLLECESL